MNLSDILHQAHGNILSVHTHNEEISDLSAQITEIEQTRTDILDARGQIELHRRELRTLRGRITNMLFHLDKLDLSLQRDDDSLLIQDHIARKGVTKVKINQQAFYGPKRQSPTTRRTTPKADTTNKVADKDLQKLRAALTSNPQLLAQLQAKLMKASS